MLLVIADWALILCACVSMNFVRDCTFVSFFFSFCTGVEIVQRFESFVSGA